MKTYTPFYKVLVIKVELLESTIIDERHFGNDVVAREYAESMARVGYVTVTVNM